MSGRQTSTKISLERTLEIAEYVLTTSFQVNYIWRNMLDLFRSGIVAPPQSVATTSTAYAMEHALVTIIIIMCTAVRLSSLCIALVFEV